MAKFIEGNLIIKEANIGIIASRFNDFVTGRLVDGAIEIFLAHGIKSDEIEVVKVPGAFEIFQASKRMVQSKKYHALICLGAIIRGETPHFDYLAAVASKSLAEVAQEASIPVLFGILTTDTLEQAIARAGAKGHNKGAEAAIAAIEMINLFKKI